MILLNKFSEGIPHYKEGAVVPIVGAVAGVAGTVSQISAQNKAANAQEASLTAQAKSSSMNTKARLLEIERQRMFAESQSKLDEIGRNQARAFEVNESAIARGQLSLARQQALLNEEAQNLFTQREEDINLGKVDQAETARKVQTGIAGRQIADQNTLQRLGNKMQFQQGMLGTELGYGQQLFNIEGQREGDIRQANQQNIAAQQQAAQAFESLASDFETAGRQQDMALRQQAAQRAQLAFQGGNLSASDQALMGRNIEDLATDLVSRTKRVGRSADSISQNVELQDALRDYLVGTAERSADMSERGAGGERLLARTSLMNQRGLNEFSRKEQAALARLGLRSQNLTARQQEALQRFGITAGADNQEALARLAAIEELGQLDMDESALDLLDAAQENRFAIAKQQQMLNEEFADTALSSQRLTTQQAGAAQQAMIAAQKSAIQRPGFLSIAGRLGQAGIGAYNAISGMNQPTPTMQPTNPFASTSFGYSGYNPGFLSGGGGSYNAFNTSGSGNYSFASNVNLGGGF